MIQITLSLLQVSCDGVCMKLEAVGLKFGCIVTLEYVGGDKVFKVECDGLSHEDVNFKMFELGVEDLVRADFCFTSAVPLENTDPYKLLWIIQSFFDGEYEICGDPDITDILEGKDGYDGCVF